jgi:hypothetical protein
MPYFSSLHWTSRLRLGAIASLLSFQAAAAGTFDGHYVGNAPASASNSMANCQQMRADISIRDGTVSGTGKYFAVSPKGTIVDNTRDITGTVAPDGSAELAMFGITFPAKVTGGRLVGKLVTPRCNYDFDIPLSR